MTPVARRMPKRNTKGRSKKRQSQNDVHENHDVDLVEHEEEEEEDAQLNKEGQNAIGADDSQDDEEPVLTTAVVFQCGACRTIVGDTTTGYDAHAESKTIILKAARNVITDSRMQMSDEGFDAGCTYKRVKCSFCRTVIGRVYSSTTPQLDSRRLTYCLDQAALQSFQLGSCRDTDGKFAQVGSNEADKLHPAMSQEAECQFVSSQSFEALRTHVASFTEAFNRVQEAISELREGAQSVPGIQQGLGNIERMMLLWEDRFKSLDLYKKRTEACENRLEDFASYDEELSVCKNRIMQLEASLANGGPNNQHSQQIHPANHQQLPSRLPMRVESSPFARRATRSPALTPQRRMTQPQESSPHPKRARRLGAS